MFLKFCSITLNLKKSHYFLLDNEIGTIYKCLILNKIGVMCKVRNNFCFKRKKIHKLNNCA